MNPELVQGFRTIFEPLMPGPLLRGQNIKIFAPTSRAGYRSFAIATLFSLLCRGQAITIFVQKNGASLSFSFPASGAEERDIRSCVEGRQLLFCFCSGIFAPSPRAGYRNFAIASLFSLLRPGHAITISSKRPGCSVFFRACFLGQNIAIFARVSREGYCYCFQGCLLRFSKL